MFVVCAVTSNETIRKINNPWFICCRYFSRIIELEPHCVIVIVRLWVWIKIVLFYVWLIKSFSAMKNILICSIFLLVQFNNLIRGKDIIQSVHLDHFIIVVVKLLNSQCKIIWFRADLFNCTTKKLVGEKHTQIWYFPDQWHFLVRPTSSEFISKEKYLRNFSFLFLVCTVALFCFLRIWVFPIGNNMRSLCITHTKYLAFDMRYSDNAKH